MSRKGQIQLIIGPMFSGKTTELIRRLKRYKVAKYECLIIKYALDVRYEEVDSLTTHDRQTLSAVSTVELMPLKTDAQNYDVIGIDEGQFFPDIADFAEEMANSGKTVIIAGLNGTYKRRGFNNILKLVPLSEDIIKLSAICMNCLKEEASYTKRIVKETDLEMIGGLEKYKAMCRKCFFIE